MILQALKEYYDRKAADSESDIAPEGFERKEIPFVVVLNAEGQFVSLEDTRERVGKKLLGKMFMVPRSKTRTGGKSYKTTFLLWDHIGYLLQVSKSNDPDDLQKAANQHKAWLNMLDALPNELKKDAGVAAILAFYKKNSGPEAVKADPNWSECIKLPSCNMTFRLADDAHPIPCRPRVREYVRALVSRVVEAKEDAEEKEIVARCLVTGEIGPIVRTHGRTPINKDTKSLVAFQRNSGYDSYGREQGYNSPVCKSAEFAYTTALNTLLKSGSQRLLVGDATTVFWASRKTRFEDEVVAFFSEPPKNDPDRNARAVADLLLSVKNGAYAETDRDTRFYVLGLAPNSARISVRFWQVGTVPEMAVRFASHFEDTRITHGPRDKDTLSLFRLLVTIATQGKSENIPPNLAGETMRAILQGLPYPQTLLQAAVRRIRAEHEISYPRAALIKACLNRMTRRNEPQQEEEMRVSLDTANTNIGYRLGRLFAALEKIQTEASPGINATIRDKFYGAASSTPVTVFGNLMRLKNHHLAKMENVGRRVNFERLLGEIVGGINDFPPHLKLEDQGRFAIGYYHQAQDFYTKKEKQN